MKYMRTFDLYTGMTRVDNASCLGGYDHIGIVVVQASRLRRDFAVCFPIVAVLVG